MAVYTERFIDAYGLNVWTEFVVPSGKRAIVRNTLVQAGNGGGAYWIYLLGRTVWYRAFTGANEHEDFETRITVYSGESLRVFTNAPDIRVVMTGYLFTEAADAGEDAPAQHRPAMYPPPTFEQE